MFESAVGQIERDHARQIEPRLNGRGHMKLKQVKERKEQGEADQGDARRTQSMTPQVFVVDTNVVAAGLITSSADSPVAAVLDAMLAGELLYLLSPLLLVEYQAVLTRPKLSALHGLSQREIEQLLVELTGNAVWRDPQDGPPAPDRGDDHLWALLRAHPGSTLITGDRLLLANPPVAASVITPRGWFDQLPSAGR